jgi:exopolyphosphatase/guanosine-5'-triphosphate,3'-diphosphate pyrophosphatase
VECCGWRIAAVGAELEAWSLRKEADYFREVLRRDLAVEVA